jgi:hypothetical protein
LQYGDVPVYGPLARVRRQELAKLAEPPSTPPRPGMAPLARYGISYWDAVIAAAARALGCRELCSEDMADGCDYGGTMVVNPFR